MLSPNITGIRNAKIVKPILNKFSAVEKTGLATPKEEAVVLTLHNPIIPFMLTAAPPPTIILRILSK